MHNAARLIAATLPVLLINATCASSQTSSDLVAENPGLQFNIMKDVAAAFFRGHNYSEFLEDGQEPGQRLYKLATIDCKGLLPPRTGNKATDGLFEVAAYVVVWRKDLAAMGYPAALWEPEVAILESKMQKILTDGERAEEFYNFIEAIVPKLSTFRKSNPSLPEVAAGGCLTAGEVPAQITTDPDDGRVTVIPAFYFLLCQEQKLDPNDSSRCNYWRELIQGRAEPLSGDYYYSVGWKDGSERKGRITIFASGKFVLKKL